MIAQPESSTPSIRPELSQPASSVEQSPLSATELYHLMLYKWRYSLEAYGFDASQVRQLMFLKWLHASGRVLP